MGITERLLSFCEALAYDDLPSEVILRVKFHVLDTIGNMFGGTSLEPVRQIAQLVKLQASSPETTVVGFPFRSSCCNSALVHGSAIEATEGQDGYRFGGNHPSSTVIPAALSLAEKMDVDGKDFITSVVAGYEVANRIARAVHPMHRLRGFIPTGTLGSLGASVAAGKLLKLEGTQFKEALGIATFILPISYASAIQEGATVKPLMGGEGARTGIESALMAKKGITGCASTLEQNRGRSSFLSVTSGRQGRLRLDKITDDLGSHFTIMDMYLKPHNGCRHAHGAIDAVLSLVHSHNLQPQHVKKILVSTYRLAKRTYIKPVSNNSNFLECQFNIPYLVSAAFADRLVGLEQLTPEKMRDSKIRAICEKVILREDKELTNVYPEKTSTRVEIKHVDGTKYVQEIDYPKGDPRNPMGEADIKAKFLANTKASGCDYDAIFHKCLNLEHITHMSHFVSLLSNR